MRAVIDPAGLREPAPGGPDLPGPAVYATPFTAGDLQARRVARGRYTPGALPGRGAGRARAGRGRRARPRARARPGRGRPVDVRHAGRRRRAAGVDAPAPAASPLPPRRPHRPGNGAVPGRGRALGLALRGLRADPVLRRGGPALLAAAGRGLLRGDGSVLVLTALPGGRGPQAGSRPAGACAGLARLARHGLAVHPLSQLLDCPATAARTADRVEPCRSRCSGSGARAPNRSVGAAAGGVTPRSPVRGRPGAGRSTGPCTCGGPARR